MASASDKRPGRHYQPEALVEACGQTVFVLLDRDHVTAALAVIQSAGAAGELDCTRCGNSLLHVAAHAGLHQVCSALLGKSGLPSDPRDWRGKTPLHIAAAKGHAQTCAALVDGKADVEARDTSGWCPLHCAAAHGRLEACRVLLERGSPVGATVTGSGTTALEIAEEAGNQKLIALFKYAPSKHVTDMAPVRGQRPSANEFDL